jgi:hypothetical protein
VQASFLLSALRIVSLVRIGTFLDSGGSTVGPVGAVIKGVRLTEDLWFESRRVRENVFSYCLADSCVSVEQCGNHVPDVDISPILCVRPPRMSYGN